MEQDERHVIDRSRGRGARADVHDDVAEFEELVRRHRLGEEIRRVGVGLDERDRGSGLGRLGRRPRLPNTGVGGATARLPNAFLYAKLYDY